MVHTMYRVLIVLNLCNLASFQLFQLMTMVIALTYSVTICVCLAQCRMIVGALHVAVLEQVHKTMLIMSR